jgi:hypothetical protein
MFIPDPEFGFFRLGSRVKKARDPGSGCASKNLNIFNPKIITGHWIYMIQDVHPRFGFFHPGSRSRIQGPKKHWIPHPGSGSATLKTVFLIQIY